MKKILFSALTMLALFGLVGCTTPTDEGGGDTGTVVNKSTTWWVKGSWDGWKSGAADKHFLTIDEFDANKLTFEVSGLYAGVSIEFVVQGGPVDPDDTFKVLPATTVTTDGTAIALVTAGTATATNITFTPLKSSYTITLDITTPAAPVLKLVPGAADALPLTETVLANALKIKGDAFSIGWTETAGTFDSVTKTVTFDVTVAAKAGGFGFSSLDGFIKYNLDVSTLVAENDTLGPVELGNTALDQKLVGATKQNSVYTVVVTLDATKAINAGRYMMNVTLKTLSTTDWAFAAPTAVQIKGDYNSWAATDPDSYAAGIATFTITASGATTQFGLMPDGGFTNLAGMVVDAASLPLTGGNATFDSVAASVYIVTADYTTATYISDGTPTVKVVLAP